MNEIDDQATLPLNRPRSAPRLLAATLALYRRYPLLFFTLAAAVIVPYELIGLAATGTGGFSRANASLGAQLLLSLLSWFLITPLISALHVNAVAEIRQGQEPQIVPVFLRGLSVLPTVVAAVIVAGLGTALGFAALIVPGVILALRWVVVAQVAAIERGGWLPALRRSHELSAGHYGHIIAFLLMAEAIVALPVIVGGMAFGDHNTSAVSFSAGLLLLLVTASFAALAWALLFYDLLARFQPSTAPVTGLEPSLDPRDYSDRDRPKGWYVDPAFPRRMRHWGGGDSPGWHGATRTPRKIRRAWEAKN